MAETQVVEKKENRTRKIDKTPNKEIRRIKLESYKNGSAKYLVFYNDENGERKSKQITDTVKRGKEADRTPGKTFGKKKLHDNPDGTVTYEQAYNDEKGERLTREIVLTPGKRGGGGKPADKTPHRVFVPKGVRNDENGTMEISVEFNDSEGERQEAFLTVSMSKNGKLTFRENSVGPKVDRPKVLKRPRKAKTDETNTAETPKKKTTKKPVGAAA